MDFGIPGHAVQLPFIEIDQRPGFAQHFLARMQVVEIFDRERIDVEMGKYVAAIRMMNVFGRCHENLRYKVVAEQGVVLVFVAAISITLDAGAAAWRNAGTNKAGME